MSFTRVFKKLLFTFAIGLLVLGTGAFLFKDQALAQLKKDMFVAADADAFEPGVRTGEAFPEIKAIHNGEKITSVESFARDKGMIFIANRSASW